MFAGAPLAYWIGFFVIVGVLVACDLALLNRRTGPRRAGSNLAFVLFLIALAASLALWLAHARGRQIGLEFASGYLIELSLSVDNLFVFLVMFRSFGLNAEEQRKALTLGVAGSIIMRALFMFFGIALLRRFAWIEYLFGVFLLVAAVRLLSQSEDSGGSSRWPSRWPKQWMARLTARFGGNTTGVLLSAVIAIELVDLAFALDSIPAVLAVTRDPFVAYTSNILAVLGLRSLYFLLAGLLGRLRFLHYGLAAILAFVGAKMIATRWFPVPIGVSLGIIVLALVIAAAASLLSPATEGIRHEEWK
jgi:tellurite resistance protein TerC